MMQGSTCILYGAHEFDVCFADLELIEAGDAFVASQRPRSKKSRFSPSVVASIGPCHTVLRQLRLEVLKLYRVSIQPPLECVVFLGFDIRFLGISARLEILTLRRSHRKHYPLARNFRSVFGSSDPITLKTTAVKSHLSKSRKQRLQPFDALKYALNSGYRE